MPEILSPATELPVVVAALARYTSWQDQFSHLPQLPDGWIRIPSKSAGQCYYVSLGCTFALCLLSTCFPFSLFLRRADD